MFKRSVATPEICGGGADGTVAEDTGGEALGLSRVGLFGKVAVGDEGAEGEVREQAESKIDASRRTNASIGFIATPPGEVEKGLAVLINRPTSRSQQVLPLPNQIEGQEADGSSEKQSLPI